MVDANGQLAVQNQQLVNKNDEAVMLRGISYDWHATVVRASMGVDEENCYVDDPETAVKCVTSIVDGAIKAGIYVLIDWHCHHIRTDEAVGFFTTMANKYKDYPNVIYEIYNEPTDTENWEATGAGQYDTDSWNKWVTWMESNKISYLTWCFTDDSMLTTTASSTGPWDDSELTQWGKDARTETLKNWSEPIKNE